jgi:phage terminase Nu1 subunit (DNA packaging protein)
MAVKLRQYPIKDFASTIGVTARTVYHWRDLGLKTTDSERGELVGFSDWAHFYARGRNNSDSHDYQVEKARLTKLQADREELRVAELKKELIRVDFAEKAWSSVVAAFRSRMLVIPDRVASLTANNEVKQELKTLIYEALDELSKLNADQFVPGDTEDATLGPEDIDAE